MNARTPVAIAILVTVAGCLGGAAPASTPTASGGDPADLRVTGIGQHDDPAAKTVRVSLSVTNEDDRTVRDATATVTLFNGSAELTSRVLDLGDVSPGGSVSLSVTFDVAPERVDGRRVTFGTA